MAKRYPKYIKATGNTLRFQRAIPRRLRHVSPTQLWTCPLGLSITATDSDISRASARAQDTFELYCRTLENSSPEAYADSEIERLAEDFLRRKGLKVGEFADVLNPNVTAQEEQQNSQLQAHPHNYADKAIPEFDDITDNLQREERGPTVQEAAVVRAWEVVQKRKNRQPRTLNSLWSAYLENRGVDPSSREGLRIQRRWDGLIHFVKDAVVTTATPDHIEIGLDEYVDHELQRGIAPPSITRQLSEPIACFKWANKYYRLKWRTIEIRPMRPYKPKEKHPLPQEQQIELIDHCFDKADWVAAALLLMLQGGCMPSEIARLRPEEDLNLNAEIPYVLISGGEEGKTKQEARKRFVPVVISRGLLADKLPEAITRLAAVKEPSATITKRLRTLLGKQYSSHCLRHTLRTNATSAGANPMLLQTIGGWSGGNINKVMLNYGARGLGNSEVLQTLYEESLKIHQHLIAYLQGTRGAKLRSRLRKVPPRYIRS